MNFIYWASTAQAENPGIIGSPPVIELKGGEETIARNSVHSSIGARAIDDVDGDISNSIVITNNFDLTTVGVYQEFYNVVNSNGQSAAQVVRTVNVLAETDPIFFGILPFQLT